MRRSCGLNEQTRQRTQYRQINQEVMMEFDSESLRNASQTLPESRQHSPRFGRILFYAAYVLHYGLSEVQISYLEELMKVLYQHEPPVWHREIKNFFKNILESYNIRISYFCSSCTDLMEATQNYCQNAMCSIYRREVWPLYLRIDGLSPTHANELFNSILSGVIYTRLKPNEKLIETLFSSFYESLGNNEEERRKELSQRRQERSQWGPHLYHALQKALRDVRASKYKEIETSWTPSNEQKKKSMGVAEENNETTSNKQKRKAFVEVAEDNIEMVEDVTYLCL